MSTHLKCPQLQQRVKGRSEETRAYSVQRTHSSATWQHFGSLTAFLAQAKKAVNAPGHRKTEAVVGPAFGVPGAAKGLRRLTSKAVRHVHFNSTFYANKNGHPERHAVCATKHRN